MSKYVLSDSELWRNYQAGDSDILTFIYKKYANDLFDYGLKITNNEQLVQDCIQEIFIHLIKKKRTLLITSSIRNYLYKSLRNKIIEEHRHENKNQKLKQAVASEDEPLLFDMEHEIIQKEEDIRMEKCLEEAVKDLSGKQKEVIYLKFTKGLSYEEIAFLFDIDIASARTLLYRTLKTIRGKLE